MIVKHLELKNQYFRNITLDGITVKAFLNGLAGAGSEQCDFSKSTIRVILYRGGKPHVIMQNNLKILGLASSIDSLNQSAFASTLPVGMVLGANQSALLSFFIPFGGHINLRNDDEIYIEVENSAGLFTDNNLLAASYLEVKPKKSVGIEHYVPKINTFVIQANESSNQYMIGDNLIRLVVLNYDKPDFKNAVISTLTFSTDRLDEVWNFADLVANKLSRYGRQLIPLGNNDLAVDMQEDQSFVITDFGQEFDAVNLDINFNAANVTASSNYIVAWTYDTSMEIIQKAVETQKKHDSKTMDKLKKSPSLKS